MVEQTVGDGHHVVGKDFIPLAKLLVTSNHEARTFVAVRNKLKEHMVSCVRLSDVASVIFSHEIHVDERGGGNELHADTLLNQLIAKGRTRWVLPTPQGPVKSTLPPRCA